MKYHYKPEDPRITRARAALGCLVNVVVTVLTAISLFTLWWAK